MLLPEPSQPGLPIFLENSPQIICDQILWLIKHANLDFQVKETPFSLNLSLKKRFAHHWNSSQFQPKQNQRMFTPDQNLSTPLSSLNHRRSHETFPETGSQNFPESHVKTEKDIFN
jgi:hypothetical protein